MNIERARHLSSRIRHACPEARVLVACDGSHAVVFASLAGHTARINRLGDWRANFLRDRLSNDWRAIVTTDDGVPRAASAAQPRSRRSQ